MKRSNGWRPRSPKPTTTSRSSPKSSSSGAPTIQSVTRADAASAVTNADTVVFRVVFSEDVTGVGNGDFVLTGTPGNPCELEEIRTVIGFFNSPDGANQKR